MGFVGFPNLITYAGGLEMVIKILVPHNSDEKAMGKSAWDSRAIGSILGAGYALSRPARSPCKLPGKLPRRRPRILLPSSQLPVTGYAQERYRSPRGTEAQEPGTGSYVLRIRQYHFLHKIILIALEVGLDERYQRKQYFYKCQILCF